MRPNIDPKVDYAFKRLFGSEETKDLLTSVLNAVLQPLPGEEVTGVELQNTLGEKDEPDERLAVLDVKARDATGRWFDVEMQMLAPTDYPKRVLYYWAKLYTDQLAAGGDWEELRPAISISFLNSRRFPDDPNFHHHFRLRSGPEGKLLLTDHLAIHLIELPKFDLGVEQLTRPLFPWCYFLRHAVDLDTEALPARLDVPQIRRALEVLTMMSQSEREREIYEGRLKARRDKATDLKAARLIGQIQVCQQILKRAVSDEEVLMAMPSEELTRLAEELKRLAMPPA